MRRFEQIFVDLDRTLFDTSSFSVALSEALATVAGISPEVVDTQMPDFYKHNGELRHYEYFSHASFLGVRRQVASRLMKEVLKQDFVYPDVKTFLSSLGMHHVQILTYGESDFQSLKITGSSQLNGLPYHVVQEPKGRWLMRKYPGVHGVLLDDHPDQELPDGFTLIIVDREGKVNTDDTPHTVFESLEKALPAVA